MKCRFYLQTSGSVPLNRGPFDFADEAQARAAANAQLDEFPNVDVIDVWCDHGELFRVERSGAAR